MKKGQDDNKTRLDKWLWAARFFKTRSVSTEAIAGGKIRLNDNRAKPAKQVNVGDEIRIRLGIYEYTVVVRGLSSRRGPTAHAALLYEETQDSMKRREEIMEQSRMQPQPIQRGRPMTKKERREIIRLKRGGYRGTGDEDR